MDFKRVISSLIVAIPVIIMLIIPNKYIIGILISIISIIAMHEYLNAVSKVCNPIRWVSYLSCIIIFGINFIPDEKLMISFMLYIPSIILLLFINIIATDMKINFKDMAYTLLGICYISVFMTFLTLVDGMQNGKILMIYILIAAFGTDVFAYLVGMKFGKHKFSKVSPKKSIEGCIGGTLGSVMLAIIYTYIINRFFNLGFEFSYFNIIVNGIVLSLIGQIGDFSASCIKRYVDIKDYSNLIPGHGGMLDRIDSVLFIAPYAYLLFTLI